MSSFILFYFYLIINQLQLGLSTQSWHKAIQWSMDDLPEAMPLK